MFSPHPDSALLREASRLPRMEKERRFRCLDAFLCWNEMCLKGNRPEGGLASTDGLAGRTADGHQQRGCWRVLRAVVTGEWPAGLSRGSLSGLPCPWAIAVMGAPLWLPEGRKMERDPQMEADGLSSRATCEGPVHPLLGFRAV